MCMFDHDRQLDTIKKMIASNSTKIYQSLIDDDHIKNHGEDLLQVACETGNKDAVEFLTKKGIGISNPPEWTRSRYYRMTPYILQAVKSGSIDTVNAILGAKADIKTTGFVCLSKKYQNNVSSNVIGCAAYHGHPKLLKYLISKWGGFHYSAVNHKCEEKHDNFNSRMSTVYKKDFVNYTPLMLSIANGK